MNLYPGSFSVPGKTQIKQYIGKLSQQEKSKLKNKNRKKSYRGRNLVTVKKSWHILLTEIIDTNPKEKPEIIYNYCIDKFNNDVPDDLPITSDDKPDKIKVRSTIARFKNNLKNIWTWLVLPSLYTTSAWIIGSGDTSSFELVSVGSSGISVATSTVLMDVTLTSVF